jgi:putative transferase (TIGR04331 family)
MVIREGGYRFVPNDMADFESLYVTDAWNEMIYGQLLAFMTVPIKYVEAVIHRSNKPKKSCDGQIKRSLHKLVDNTLNRFVRNDECFFISSYLPIKQALCLQFRLAQLPKFWHSTALPKITSDTNKRKWDKIAPENIDDFSEVVRYMIPRHIPLAYLEGYHKLLTLTEKLPWPKQPKVIFTSNSYNSDDVFKVWTAEKVEMGSKLIIGQHGGYFGMGRWCFAEDHQLAISDRFITWGWAEPEKLKVFPVGNIKGLGKSVKCSKGGLALLVQVVHPRYSYWMYGTPISGQWLDYFEDQYRFANALPSKHQDQLLVRLYAQDYGWCQKQRWLDRFPKINIDDGIKSMESLIKESRLYISTYNATTYLESMSLNIPTIIFWNPKYWELRDSAVPYFEKLKSVGIFHETPESAAKQMSVVWDDVAGWWEDQAVQAVRKEFCDRYARIPEKPLKMMENLFREVAGST